MPAEQGSVGTRLEEQLHGIALDSALSRANRERTVRFETACWPVLRRRRLSGFVSSCSPLRSSAGRGCELPGDGLKILVSYPDGFADMEDLKREWLLRMSAAKVADAPIRYRPKN
ncbi:hypothetical protein [Bradyrhizobium sp. WSM1417]|uniref:hypothetical protein n=1 Tax=Bradyrhizobium sp. WSM1417 TaxID=754500 RepID=UPI000486E903|nr:hypothetical protein [Bradyrhizobium sp. WSM1417]